MPYIGILGGSFNPLHIGHMRMALEALQSLPFEKILFLPCASPPHKKIDTLLPFALRAQMIATALLPYPSLEVCTIEAEREGPSYTYDTLVALQQLYPGRRLGFIMGCEELDSLSTWSRWEGLIDLADFITLPRRSDYAAFTSAVYDLWPHAQPCNPPYEGVRGVEVEKRGCIFFIDQPLLAISSSLLRANWNHGKNVDFFMPISVVTQLEEHKELVHAVWREVAQHKG